jgi:hypothetical protein
VLAHQIDPAHFIHDRERARCAQLLWYRGPLPESFYTEPLPPPKLGKLPDMIRKRLEEQMGSQPGTHFRTAETARARVSRLAMHLERFHDGMNDDAPFDEFTQPVLNDMQHFYQTANFTIGIGGATHPQLGRVMLNVGNAVWEFVVGPADKITSHLRRGRLPIGDIYAYEYAQYAVDRAGARFGAYIVASRG